MTLSGTESGVEALSDSELQLYESCTTRAWATVLPPTAHYDLTMTTHLPGGLAGASESVIEEIQLRVPLEHYTGGRAGALVGRAAGAACCMDGRGCGCAAECE